MGAILDANPAIVKAVPFDLTEGSRGCGSHSMSAKQIIRDMFFPGTKWIRDDSETAVRDACDGD